MEQLRERIREVIIQVLRDNRHVDPAVDAILKAVDDDRAPEVERHYSISVLATDIIDGRDQKLAKSEARVAALREALEVACRLMGHADIDWPESIDAALAVKDGK